MLSSVSTVTSAFNGLLLIATINAHSCSKVEFNDRIQPLNKTNSFECILQTLSPIQILQE